MQIIVDAHIPGARDVFSGFGEVVAIPGHEIGPEHVRHARVLVVRTVTTVNEALLVGSSVQFVGSATAGMDHVDTAWLAANRIAWANAHGANAGSVVEYVLAAVAEGLELGAAPPGNARDPLHGRTMGVVGHGAVGSRLAARFRALGCLVKVCDPFRPEGDTDLDNLLRDADIVSLHVPLTHDGTHPTRGLLDAERIARMKPGAMLIQTSRGGVVGDQAAVRARQEGRLSWLVLDVWQDEPLPPPDLVAGVDLATPHIAGYSRDAKSEGVRQVARALRDWLGASEGGTPAEELDDREAPDMRSKPTERIVFPDPSARTGLAAWIRPMYDIRADDARFRATLGLPTKGTPPLSTILPSAEARRAAFHDLRASYPPRWSFHRYVPGSYAAGQHPNPIQGIPRSIGMTVPGGGLRREAE
ncbi:MAG: 4-phosphoerythronate dehydrogenase [Rhodothermales bacterium]